MKPDFIALLNQTLPKAEVEGLLNAISSTSPSISVRLNRKKIARLGLNVESVLTVDHEAIPHCADGFFLKTRPLFTTDPSLHAGLYYVQEANSMWIGEMVRRLVADLPNNALVLDMCAAPGGKTTHVSSVLRDGDILVANEVISQRNSILFENVSKWGDGNTIITKADSKLYSKSPVNFDIILCDAPCSGEGLFRKDNAAIEEWSLEHVDLCAQRQQRIVFELYDNLKPGGYFIYSTCTYNRKENEDNVLKFCEELGFEVVDMGLGIENHLYSLEKGMYRCMPHLSVGEGLFFAVLKKPNIASEFTSDLEEFHVKKHPPKNKKTGGKTPEIPAEITELFPESSFFLTSKDGEYYGIKHSNRAWIEWIMQQLPGVVHFGFPIGQFMKNRWKPHVAVALLCDSVLEVNRVLTDAELLLYLRREFIPHVHGAMSADSGVREFQNEGITVLGFTIHGKIPVLLGVGNSVRNGINNLWPMEWRVRSIFQDTHRICG